MRAAIGGRDWQQARTAAELMAAGPLPASAEELKARAEALGELLNAARAGRAHLVDSLARVRAARRFQGTADRFGPEERQNFVDSVNF